MIHKHLQTFFCDFGQSFRTFWRSLNDYDFLIIIVDFLGRVNSSIGKNTQKRITEDEIIIYETGTFAVEKRRILL
jgi:hypothetical protein